MPKPAKTGAATLLQRVRTERHDRQDVVEQIIVKRSRLVDKELSAQYLGTSPDTIERLIQSGALPTVRLPVERAKNGRGKTGTSRRLLIDVRDLDALIDRSKEFAR